MKAEEDEKIKVFRVLVYEGRRSEVEKTLKNSYVRPLRLRRGLSIIELLCTEMTPGTIVGVPLPKEGEFGFGGEEPDFEMLRVINGEKK